MTDSFATLHSLLELPAHTATLPSLPYSLATKDNILLMNHKPISKMATVVGVVDCTIGQLVASQAIYALLSLFLPFLR